MAPTAARHIHASCRVLTWCPEDGSLKGRWLQSRSPRAVTCSVNSLATLGAQKSRGFSLQAVTFQHERPEGGATSCAQHARGGDGWPGKGQCDSKVECFKRQGGFGGLKH